MNFVHLIGRMGKDPETRFTAEGLKVTALVVATSARKGGNEETIWWRVTLWGDRWDKMMPHLKKGKPVMIGGEMRKPEIYTDKTGQPQIGSIEVTADYIKFVPFGRSDQPEQASASGAAGEKRQEDSSFGSKHAHDDMASSMSNSSDEDPLPF